MDVYIDLLLLENFIVNSFLALILNQILKEKIIYKRIILSGLVGALYTIVMVLPILKPFASFPVKILVTFLVVYIATNKKDFFNLLKGTITFLLLSILLSGFCLMFAIYQNGFVIGEGFSINNLSFKFIILSLMIIYIILFRIIAFIKDKIIFSKLIYDLIIMHGGIEIKIKAFLDTGNELTEPATCLPVILVERKYFKELVLSEKNKYKIPYQAINGHKGLLDGFEPDQLYLSIDDKEEFSNKKAIICLCDEKLSRTEEFGALLSRGIL